MRRRDVLPAQCHARHIPVGALPECPGTASVSATAMVSVTATATDSATVTATATATVAVTVTGDAVNPLRAGTSYACVASYFYDVDSIRSFTG